MLLDSWTNCGDRCIVQEWLHRGPARCPGGCTARAMPKGGCMVQDGTKVGLAKAPEHRPPEHKHPCARSCVGTHMHTCLRLSVRTPSELVGYVWGASWLTHLEITRSCGGGLVGGGLVGACGVTYASGLVGIRVRTPGDTHRCVATRGWVWALCGWAPARLKSSTLHGARH